MSQNIPFKEALAYVCCPDCLGDLSCFEHGGDSGLYCASCKTAFPAIEGIPIILDKNSRNAGLETAPVEALLKIAASDLERDACINTVAELGKAQAEHAYAWEDESHWSEVYQQQLSASADKNWNDRLWQRNPMFAKITEYLQRQNNGRARVIIDVGCGEGQDFREFLAKSFNPGDLYIGLDISLPGLMLNRSKNPHKRALYVLGSADNSPLRRAIADVIISLGTLHHMESKENGLPILKGMLRSGVIALSDPINGQFLPEYLRFSRGQRSAHDDSIDVHKLKQLIGNTNLNILYERQISGIVYILFLRLLRPLILNSKGLHSFVHHIDDMFNKIFGRVFSIFRPRGLLLVLGSAQSS